MSSNYPSYNNRSNRSGSVVDNPEYQRLRLQLFISECDLNRKIPSEHRNVVLSKLNDLLDAGQLKTNTPIQPFLDDILESLKLIDKMNQKLNNPLVGQNLSTNEKKIEEPKTLSIEGNNESVNIKVDQPNMVQDNWELVNNKQVADTSNLRLDVTNIN
jgi:hypothetical protein